MDPGGTTFNRGISLMSIATVNRKSTRLNSSHGSHLVCRLLLEKKNKQRKHTRPPRLPALRHAQARTRARSAALVPFWRLLSAPLLPHAAASSPPGDVLRACDTLVEFALDEGVELV